MSINNYHPADFEASNMHKSRINLIKLDFLPNQWCFENGCLVYHLNV